MYLVLADAEIRSVTLFQHLSSVKTDFFDTNKNADCTTISNHAGCCNQEYLQSSDVSRECFVSFTGENRIEALTGQSNNDNENTLCNYNGIYRDKELFGKTNYYYHLSSINAKTKSLGRSKFLFMIYFNTTNILSLQGIRWRHSKRLIAQLVL